jgi:hypothetical protein
VGVADSRQITASGGMPPYSFTMAAGTLPPGLSLSGAGVIGGTPTTAGSYQFTITATDTSTPASTGSQPYMLQVAQATVTIHLSPATLPDATVEAADSQQITASGGTPPYVFSWSGTLPPGLSLSGEGVISGTPTTAGSYQFTITAIDSSVAPNKVSQPYTLQIAPGTATIILSPTTLPAAQGCLKYTAQITATGGTPPYVFSWAGGPPGLTLSPSGFISGVLMTYLSYPVTITATDSAPTANSGSQSYTLYGDCG